MEISRIEFTKADVKKWKKATEGMTMREIVLATSAGEGSLRNAILHGWGSENTKNKLDKFCASKKQTA